MAVDDVNWGVEEITLKEKKLSREEKKNEMAMRLFNKMENVTIKPEPKPRIQQTPASLPSKPRKKVKVGRGELQGELSEKQSPQQNNEFESSSVSQHQNGKDRSKQLNVINSLYILNDSEDIYSHLVDYEMTERARYIEALNSSQLDACVLPTTAGGLHMFPQDAVDRTGRAFSKIQNKFQELRTKLVRLNSKEQREFGSQFLNVDYLLN